MCIASFSMSCSSLGAQSTMEKQFLLVKPRHAWDCCKLLHIANCYILAHRPTVADLKKYKVFKDLKRNTNIVILKPDKVNGVVIMDRSDYDSGIFKIISDSTKFNPLKEDPTLLRESQLQRFLRKLKTNGHLDPKVYSKIYPSGSHPCPRLSQPFYGA